MTTAAAARRPVPDEHRKALATLECARALCNGGDRALRSAIGPRYYRPVAVRTPGARLPPGTKLLERLTQEALIEPDDQQRAILHAQRIDGRCEDALIEIGAMSENDLLKYLANVFRTRFVSTEKLSKASIAENLLALVPRKVAERMLVFPILYDPGKQALSVVAGALGEHDVAKQVQLVSNVREVNVYVARPATVQALIRKHYDGDRGAFAELAARYPSVARTLGSQGSRPTPRRTTTTTVVPALARTISGTSMARRASSRSRPPLAPPSPIATTFSVVPRTYRSFPAESGSFSSRRPT